MLGKVGANSFACDHAVALEAGFLVLPNSEEMAVLGSNCAVREYVDRQDKVFDSGGVGEGAFAGDELVEVLHQCVGDFELGFAFGGVGDGEAVGVVPRGDEAFAEGFGEEGEGGARLVFGAAHRGLERRLE